MSWTIKDEYKDKVNFSLYDFADRLRVRGWQVPAYPLPENREDLVIQRILVRHGFSRDLASLLIDDFYRTLKYFEDRPQAVPLTEKKAGGFRH